MSRPTRELTENQARRIASKIRVAQLVWVALVFGVLVFAGMLAMIANWEEASSSVKMMTLMGAATGVALCLFSFLVPFFFSSSVMERGQIAGRHESPVTDAEPIENDKVVDSAFQLYLTSQVAAWAMVEAAIFLNLMVFMIESGYVSVSVAGLGLVVLLASFPFGFRVLKKVASRYDEAAGP